LLVGRIYPLTAISPSGPRGRQSDRAQERNRRACASSECESRARHRLAGCLGSGRSGRHLLLLTRLLIRPSARRCSFGDDAYLRRTLRRAEVLIERLPPRLDVRIFCDVRYAVTLLILVGVGVLVALAGVDALRSGTTSVSPTVSRASESTPIASPAQETREQEIERRGRAWASFFATGPAPPYGQACVLMTQPLCERIGCEHVDGARIEKCISAQNAFRRSFEQARVVDVVVRGNRGAARFSNGEIVQFRGDRGTWLVSELGKEAGRGFFD
jgi:hypothetical protein